MNTAAAGARSLAAYAVARVLREGVTLDAALQAALAAAPAALAPSVRSLSYGAVRGYYRHEALLGRLLSQPVRSLDFLVRALLSVALFELEDARTPEYAVVDAAVETAKATDAARAGGLINAVLRRYLRERKTLDADIARSPAARHCLADLAGGSAARRLAGALDAIAGGRRRAGADVAARESLDAPRPRLIWRRCARAGIGAHGEPRVPQALALDSPCDVDQLPGFADGVVSVQDLGAQCVAFPLEPRGGSAGARCLRGAGRQDRAHGRARAAPCQTGRGRHRSAASRRGHARTWRAASLHAELVIGDAARTGRVVGRRAVRSHFARRAVLRARRDPPAS